MRLFNDDDMLDEDDDDDMSGYTVIEDNSVFNIIADEKEEETIATPIPENEQTVILNEPDVRSLRDGAKLTLKFAGNECSVYNGSKKAGSLKSAYVQKLKAERGGQLAEVFYKNDVPPMIRIVFGSGTEIPKD